MSSVVRVAPERLERWLAGFAERHGAVVIAADAEGVLLSAVDGATARCEVPFPPLHLDAGADPCAALVVHAGRNRRVGLLLVRLGGFAVAVVEGTTVGRSKVGSRPVHGRAAAGGWSQRRFARRREGQARVALEAAADVAARILLPVAADLDAVVTGGDRRAVDAVMEDARLQPLHGLVVPQLLDVPTPDRRVLDGAAARYRAVAVHLDEPDAPR